MKPAISVHNLSKEYRLGLARNRNNNLTENLRYQTREIWDKVTRLVTPGKAFTKEESFWALKDVSFEVNPGEVVGIIGRNGAGKSTLLKILSKIVEPTSGHALVRGRMGSLLEVGTGFHPELTGRENIYLNGAILGMKREEINRRFDEIVAFAEVEKFLDTPVKRYSSGMYVRLAFAVAAHLEPEILVIDEVLAVGDAGFQEKCMGQMQRAASHGRTIIFVSHNMPAIRKLTQRCVYLEKGKMICVDDTRTVLDRYVQKSMQVKSASNNIDLNYFRRGNIAESSVRITKAWFTDLADKEISSLKHGDSFSLHIQFESKEYQPELCFTLTLHNEHGDRVSTMFSKDINYHTDASPGLHTMKILVNKLPLSPGKYTSSFGINRNANSMSFDVITDYPAFNVEMLELQSGEIDWSHRPWGAIHWSNVEWRITK